MIDFVLRHGSDLLALEALKGFDGNIREQGKLFRQGDLVVYERQETHTRRVFLFDNTLILAKTTKLKHQPDIFATEVYECQRAYKVFKWTCLLP